MKNVFSKKNILEIVELGVELKYEYKDLYVYSKCNEEGKLLLIIENSEKDWNIRISNKCCNVENKYHMICLVDKRRVVDVWLRLENNEIIVC